MSGPLSPPRPAWGLMFLLALIWGGSFLASRIALEELGVFTVVAFRVGGAAALLWGWVLARGIAVPGGLRRLAGYAGMGVLNAVIPFSLIVWGQQHIASGLAAILNAATAIFGVLVAAVAFHDERLTPARALGVLTGFAGVATAIGPGHLAALDAGSLGQIAVLGAAFSYALAGAFGKLATRGLAPEAAATGMVSAAALVMVPLALAHDGLPSFAFRPATWGALAYLAGAASALAYLIYFAVLRRGGAGNLSLVTLMIPPFALILGAASYGEALPLRAYLGFAILAGGLLLIDGRILAQNSREKPARSG